MDSGLEDASILRLGEAFKDATCLTNAEVTIHLANAKNRFEENDRLVPETLDKTLVFVNRFSQIKHPVANSGVVTSLRQDLESRRWPSTGDEGEIRLEQFEIASLINLKPEDFEEASALIPSLAKKIDENQITEILDKINRSIGSTN